MKLKSYIPLLPVIAALCLACGLPVRAQSFLTNGLVAYYPFNGTAADASGNGFDGIASPQCTLTTDRFGNPGYAVFITNEQNSAEADTGRIDIPPAAINSLTSGTISAWIKPADITYSDITDKQNDAVNSYAVFTIGGHGNPNGPAGPDNPGTLYFRSQNSAANASSTATVALNVWQHVVVTFNTNSCSFYINGIPCGTTSGDYSIPGDLSPNVTTTIGCMRGDGWCCGQVSIGSFDDVRIYNRDLSAAEVKDLYLAESTLNVKKAAAKTGAAVYVELTNLEVGFNYQLQESTNHGFTWQNVGLPFTALTTDFTYGYWKAASQGSLLFRVKQAD